MKDHSRTGFNRRAFLLGGVKLSLLSVLGGRLYYLQLSEGKKYKTLADGNRIRLIPIISQRGNILDRHNRVIAKGIPNYKLVYDVAKDKEKNVDTINKLFQILNYNAQQAKNILDKISKHKGKKLFTISESIKWSQLAEIEVNSGDLPGVYIENSNIRKYTNSGNFSHITGYIGRPSQDEIGDNILANSPSFLLGKMGIEKSMEGRLAGTAGVRKMEVNSRGGFIRELESSPAIDGDNIKLSVHSKLQDYIAKRIAGKGGLKSEGASAVVMNVQNGEVLGMVSVPTYDPNQFIGGISHNKWQQIISNIDNPLNNRVISSQYSPGSTFKLVTALAALEKGLSPHDTYSCSGSYWYGGREFHCWNRYGHGAVNMRKGIGVSCNVYFFNIARKLGVDRMAAMAAKLGLGEKTDIDLPDERAGLVPSTRWKLGAKGKSWYGGETLNTAIGQGYVLATPIQIALMTARIANGGKQIKPTILRGGNDGVQYNIADIDPAHLAEVQKGMDYVVNHWRGGAYKNRIDIRGFEMAGKTGTVQVISNKTFKYVPENVEERYHAVFTAYAPVKNPKYAVAVVVEHGGYGSAIAAPIGRDILLKTQLIMR